ncbi:flagellar basal body-associated FliL family protein [Yoonia vestfoldensis]|uniref:flagellar basal body-associated FliL family protein n=1 Tax=Yoonia vestfoldensis TaxID=245188 RepID=UPI00037FA109|nr:flagellar basal body-associated FliL family protein [Yoonia vestfoldensis]
MTAAADPAPEPRKGSKKPLFIGLALALVGGGGGFFVVQSGLLAGGAGAEHTPNHAESTMAPLDVAFVALDPLVISLPATNGRDHLRFSAQLEVPHAYVAEVEAIKPRIVDVLNGYLRAVALAELENPAALARMRSQMLRRVQVVAGDGRISDLLIMEFVLS